jgi:lysophospholipid acyltransferase (LPLAT)-like uncharacterized protein
VKGWKAVCLAYLGKALLRLLFWSCRIEMRGLDRFIEAAKKGRCILMLWHNRLGLTPEILNAYAPQLKYVAFVSKSRDGELLSILANSYASGTSIRVASSNRHHALKVSIDRLKEGKEVLVFTPDGPRGPRYRVKPGIALAAKAASAQIVPLTWEADRYWKLNTWDGFLLPKPFARIVVVWKEPILISEEGGESLEEITAKLEKSLSPLTFS